MRGSQEEEKGSLEFVAEVVDIPSRVFSNGQHLPYVRLTLCVHLEAIFVAHLALTSLAVPS
jgi:hypothetical protein